METKKQTAVDYLWDLIPKDTRNILEETYGAYTQAKAMEKEKHLKFNGFLESEKDFGISNIKTIERIQWYYNKFFNETYGE
jgi:hypothetical protein